MLLTVLWVNVYVIDCVDLFSDHQRPPPLQPSAIELFRTVEHSAAERHVGIVNICFQETFEDHLFSHSFPESPVLTVREFKSREVAQRQKQCN